MKELPLGIQNIREIIEENKMYVDKTHFALKLIKTLKHYFISRPRRFGKSLFLNTLEEIFKGNRTLFKGLAIDQSDYDWQEYPVLTFDFTKMTTAKPESLISGIEDAIEDLSKLYGMTITGSSYASKLNRLITALSSLNKVVVLVDEYDSAIIDNLKNIEVAEENRDILKVFFATLKGLDRYIKFTFITGVTKFSQVSLFSGPNHLTDITMDPKYAAMLGYTEEEVKSNFKEYIQEIAQKKNQSENDVMEEIRTWYNGYRFSEDELSVYNPFSALNFMKNKKPKAYWYSSGTPSFLMNELKKHSEMVSLDGTMVSEEQLMDISQLDQIDLAPLMYQAGYFTIKKYHPVSNLYELGLPNEEVRQAFFNSLLRNFAPIKTLKSSEESIKALEKQEPGFLFQHIQVGFASFAYQVFAEAKESTYQGMLLAMLYGMGFAPLSERPTHTGRIDVVLEVSNTTYIIELKLDGSAEAALKQIHDKKYFNPYLQKEKQIVLIGANFSSKERNISDWKGEVLSPSGQKIKDLF